MAPVLADDNRENHRVPIGTRAGFPAGRAGDDVDHAAQRIAAVQHRPGAANDFDALDLVEIDGVQELVGSQPVGAVVQPDAIDEDQDLVADQAANDR